jgi:hypothetical protein
MLNDSGFGIADLEEHIALLHQDYKERENATMLERKAYLSELVNKSPKCPLCGKQLLLFEVNTRSGNMIGGTAASMWQCPDLMECGYEIISNLTPEAELVKLDINSTSNGRLPYRPSHIELTFQKVRRRKSIANSSKCGRGRR